MLQYVTRKRFLVIVIYAVRYLRRNLDYNLWCRTIDRRLHEIYSVANGVRTDNMELISVQTTSFSSSQPPPP